MKSILKITAVITFFSFANIALGQQKVSPVAIEILDGKSFSFHTELSHQNYFEVSFKDVNGEVVFSEYVVHTADFSRIYNLMELNEGNYFLHLMGDDFDHIISINKKEDSLAINKSDVDAINNSKTF